MIFYEQRTGIPRVLGKLQDRIFRGLPHDDCASFAGDFLEAIPVGADIANVWSEFVQWLLVDPKDGVLQFAQTAAEQEIIQRAANLYLTGNRNPADWQAAYTVALEESWEQEEDACVKHRAHYVAKAAVTAALDAVSTHSREEFDVSSAVAFAAITSRLHMAPGDRRSSPAYQTYRRKILELLSAAQPPIW